MPRAWSDKDERQYEHIKESERDQGRSMKRAKSIAAATVNKQRSEQGRTKNASSKKRSGSAASKKKATGSRSGAAGRRSSKSSSNRKKTSRSRSRKRVN